MPRKKSNKKVDWSVFVWAIALIFLVISIVSTQVSAMNGRINNNSENVGIINGDIKAIKTDIGWIKDNLKAAIQK